MTRKRRLDFSLLLAFLLVLALALSACGGDGEDAAATTAPDTADVEEPTEAPTEEPTEAPAEEPADEPAEEPTEEPAGEAMVEPSVTVEDQTLGEDNMVTVPAATAAEPGWMVIHADADGGPGPVIGQAPVEAGKNSDITVEIGPDAATETLYAMLHIDAGEAGSYEFPGPDGPARDAAGNVVVRPFTVDGIAMAGSGGGATVALELVAEGLTAPVAFVPFPDGSGRHAIVDQVGLVHVLDETGALVEAPFLDLTGQIVEQMEDFDERGLLGLAFHPDYADNGRFFVYYSAPLREGAPEDWNHTSHISAFTVSADDANVADPASEELLLQVDEPQFNHDAGQIAFGPDGYLYIPLGDGGAANDDAPGHVEDWYEANAGGNGQDVADNLLGSILRIDVDADGADGEPYAIPADNPFAGGGEGLPEIWAYGFRNPYRISFDMGGDNALFVGDAGQDQWEEVSIVEAGGNYGWNVKEGTHCFSTETPAESPADCRDSDPEGDPLVDPIVEYLNANQEGGLGLVVIGGYVYRGDALPDFDGAYIFGDWSDSFSEGNGKLFIATPPAEEGAMWEMGRLQVEGSESGDLGAFLLSFGQDADGEIYLLTSDSTGPTGDSGRVYRMAPPGTGEAMDTGDEAQEEEAGEEMEEESAEASEVMVSIADFAFGPQEITVAPGTTVVWTNEDSVAHTVTAGAPDDETGLFDSGDMATGDTFSFTFEEAGTYAYFCRIHPNMQATVIVEE